jgi:hypothetical protein
VKAPTCCALDDLSPLILGKNAQHLERHFVLGILLIILATDSELLAAAKQLADDDGLVRRFSCDAIRSVKIDSVEQIGFGVLS